ncbi:unnamed protein product [Tilletia controversa]|uniref:Bifunctional polynucleotide phosphatase/kinase n=1 Tax=Tilletia controversa TaxID=13291 RepID=A0A8X7MQX7_9BASI|nr:hypothetical protein A4X06_0g5514 [Tilletia controversa]CAD6939488.1 unnamed protein product [Tilletia controversa]CAD6968621.1 unnamed protein product [Tilletia controversa]
MDGESSKSTVPAQEGRRRKAAPEPPSVTNQKRLRLDSSASSSTSADTGPSMKLAPIFNRAATAATASASSAPQLRWLPPFGPQSSCHVGIYGNPFPALPLDSKKKLKAAIFDLDGTLVVPKSGKTHPERKDEYDFKFIWSHSLRQVQDEHRIHGRLLIIVTNQGYFKPGMTARQADFKMWQAKQNNIGKALDIPHVVLVATAEDRFRKPAVGMWDAFWSILLNQLHDQNPSSSSSLIESGPSTAKAVKTSAAAKRKAKIPEGALLPPVRLVDIEEQYFDADESFYVGDAAGRTGDHSDVDRKWASNVGVKFFTPEQYFTDKKQDQPFRLSGWAPKRPVDEPVQSASLPLFSPTSTPLIPAAQEERDDDLILFVGPPGAGKTEFYQRHLQPWGYEWVNQDTLHNFDACKRAVKKHLEAGKGCVVDNTNRNKKTRAAYIALAKELNKQVRCFYFDVDQQRAFHNNAFRANSGLDSGRSMIPPFAIQSYYKEREIPTLDEGFSEEPKTLSWQFVETDKEKTRRYYMHYA